MKSEIFTLPDQSRVEIDPVTLQFKQVGSDDRPRINRDRMGVEPPPFAIDLAKLGDLLERPHRKFGDCFRRISDLPRYSPIGSKREFSVTSITSLYRFGGRYSGGTFCSSTTEWCFLDGGIISHSGYGFGSHSWTVVEGAETLRAICLFNGIIQPRSIKGEGGGRLLAVLLEEMTAVPLQEDSSWGLPDCADSKSA